MRTDSPQPEDFSMISFYHSPTLGFFADQSR
jgi:hypothetical protein